MAEKIIHGTGRRKTAVARVYLKKGKGTITINDRALEHYFPYAIQQVTVKSPLVVLDAEGKFDINVTIAGGAGTTPRPRRSARDIPGLRHPRRHQPAHSEGERLPDPRLSNGRA